MTYAERMPLHATPTSRPLGAPTEPDDDGSVALVQSVDRALTILSLLAQSDTDLGITDLAGHLGVHKSTASRLVATLESHELVEQQQDRGKYRLGLGLMRLSAAAGLSFDLVRIARPTATRLCATTGETINVAILSDLAALYVDQVTGSSTVLSHNWVGQRIPLHATSNGKVLLAEAPEAVLRQVMDAGLASYTPATITDPARLRAELRQTSGQGYAMAVDELETGLTAIAAPIRGADGHIVASISVSGPGFRLAADTDRLIRRVKDSAAEVSSRLGYIHRGTSH